MTVSSTSSAIIAQGNGVVSVFNFPFIGVSASDLQVTYTNASGAQTVLSSTQYTVNLNAPATGALWGVGGTVTYSAGSPIANGTSLTITRIVPLTQTTSIDNQGDFYPQAVEEALDTLCFEIQQVAARTGQMRGTWATGIAYNFGDVVVDGVNGLNTGNYYMAANANISGMWATDLAAGDWSLVINIQGINAVIGAYLPLIGGTITGNLTVDGTLTLVNGLVNSGLATMAANTVKANATNGSATPTDIALTASTLLGRGPSGNIAAIPYSTFTASIPYAVISGCLPTAISGNSTTAAITVSTGQATDSTNATIMTSAGYSWAASHGNAINGTDAPSSTLQNSTTYHMYLCSGTSGTGTFASTDYPGIGMVSFPAGYNTYARRIFSFNTNSSGAPIPYTAVEAEGGSTINWLNTQALDANVSSMTSASRTLYPLTVPSGVKVSPMCRFAGSTPSAGVIITSGDETDVAPSTSGNLTFNSAPGIDMGPNSSTILSTCIAAGTDLLTTNTSGQIGARATTTTVNFVIVTRGFKDFRRN